MQTSIWQLRAGVTAVLALVFATAAVARDATPGLTGGGSLPLGEILALAKPYPNLVLQVRLQLVRAGVKREQVICSGARFGNLWTSLGGARLAPYQCPIGKRTLVVEARQSYFDRNGRRVKAGDLDLMRRAATVKETGLTWQWK